MDKAQLPAAEISQRWATTTSGVLNWERLGVLYARVALGAAFLSGIASRFGLYGKNVGYGSRLPMRHEPARRFSRDCAAPGWLFQLALQAILGKQTLAYSQ